MTPTEFAVVIACLFGGYWLVGRLMAGSGHDEAQPEDPARQDAPQDGRQRDWQGNEMPPADEAAEPTRPWHEVLGVSPRATREQVVAAYKSKISQYHPDKVARMGPDIRALAEKRSMEINVAYETACIAARP